MDESKLKDAVSALMQDGTKRSALAELIVEYVQPEHISVDFVGMLLNARSLKPGDSLVKKVRKGLKVRTLVPGSIHLKSEVTVSERINYSLDGAIIGATANEWELESGELGTVTDIRNEMAAKLRDFYQGRVFTALSTVWNSVNTPNNFTDVGGPVTAAALENAIDHINKTAGGVKAVVGVRSAMTPITKFAAFWSNTGGANTTGSQTAIDEIRNSGKLGKYYGADLITLEQQYDAPDTNSPMLPADRILVIGKNVGEFITYGDVKSKEWTDMRPTPPQWNLELYQQWGLILDNVDGIYVIKVA